VPGAVASTIDTAFGTVDVYDADPNRPLHARRNLVVLAGDDPRPEPACLRRVERALGLYGESLDAQPLDLRRARVLTDDRPPVSLTIS
jgi:hypothetical protein